MPGFDGTGQLGQGPMTGRGLGPCGQGYRAAPYTPYSAYGARYGAGYGFGRGYGAGYGFGRGYGAGRGYGYGRRW